MAQWMLPKTAMATVSWIGTAHTHSHPLIKYRIIVLLGAYRL